MKIIAGVDIGNSTTEVCIGALNEEGKLRFLSSASRMTTGTKGTVANVAGIQNALEDAMNSIHRQIREIELIRINEAAPVIGDTAMETITETIITESSMIGHNPANLRARDRRWDIFCPLKSWILAEAAFHIF